MRSFLLGVLLLPALAFAQPVTVEKTLPCDKVDSVIEQLTKKYEEQPVWFGTSGESRVGVLINTKTNSWTVIQFNDKIACVLEAGEGFQLRPGLVGGKSI
jgi:hypothetical protein